MPYHNYIDVEREEEKRLYRIMKELEEMGESKIENYNKEWDSAMRRIGITGKPLLEADLIEPIWRTRNRKNFEKRLIRTTPGTKVTEQKGKKESRFLFRKKK